MFEFLKITAPMRIVSREEASQKGVSLARGEGGGVKKAEDTKGLQGGQSGPSKPSKRQKMRLGLLVSIFESPTTAEDVPLRDVPEGPPSSGPLTMVPIQVRPTKVVSSPPAPVPPTDELTAPSSLAPRRVNPLVQAKRIVDPFDVP